MPCSLEREREGEGGRERDIQTQEFFFINTLVTATDSDGVCVFEYRLSVPDLALQSTDFRGRSREGSQLQGDLILACPETHPPYLVSELLFELQILLFFLLLLPLLFLDLLLVVCSDGFAALVIELSMLLCSMMALAKRAFCFSGDCCWSHSLVLFALNSMMPSMATNDAFGFSRISLLSWANARSLQTFVVATLDDVAAASALMAWYMPRGR